MKFKVYVKSNNKNSIELADRTIAAIKKAAPECEIVTIGLDKPSGYDAANADHVFYIPTIVAVDGDIELGFLENKFQVAKCRDGIGKNPWFGKVKDFVEDIVDEWSKKNTKPVGVVD